MINKTNIVLFTVIVLLVLLLWRSYGEVHRQKAQIGIEQALQDTLRVYRNQDGWQRASIKAYVATVAQLQAIHADDTTAIGKLKKLVNKKTITATVIKTETAGTIVSKTEIVHDTVSVCDSLCYPTYETKYVNKWENVHIIAGKDSTKLEYKVFNDLSVEDKYHLEGKWPNRKEVGIVEVINHNPRTVTTQLSSFVLAPPPHKRGQFFAYGFMVGLISSILLIH